MLGLQGRAAVTAAPTRVLNKASEHNRRIKVISMCFYLVASMLFVADFQYVCSLLLSSFFQNVNEDLIKFKAALCWKILLKSESSLLSLHMRKH